MLGDRFEMVPAVLTYQNGNEIRKINVKVDAVHGTIDKGTNLMSFLTDKYKKIIINSNDFISLEEI